ncbi:MAG: hypothetical protein LQ337_002598 [Flavoplaca oasis]|nr:MAG: hypothetical protein LQ337_002598 [Flavoplaca oasis]
MDLETAKKLALDTFNEGLDNAWESGDLRDSGQAVLLFLKSGHPKPDIAVELKEQGEIQSGTAQSGQAGSSKDTLESLGGGGQAKVVGAKDTDTTPIDDNDSLADIADNDQVPPRSKGPKPRKSSTTLPERTVKSPAVPATSGITPHANVAHKTETVNPVPRIDKKKLFHASPMRKQ